MQCVCDFAVDLRAVQDILPFQNEAFRAQNEKFQARLLEEFRCLRVDILSHLTIKSDSATSVQFGYVSSPQPIPITASKFVSPLHSIFSFVVLL